MERDVLTTIAFGSFLFISMGVLGFSALVIYGTRRER